LLGHDRLVVPAVEPWVDLDPAAAKLEVAERRRLLQPEPAVLARGLEADRREDNRQALLTRSVEQTTRRLDLRGHVRAERAGRIREAAREVDDEHGRARAQRHRLAETRPLVNLLRLLVAHAVTCSAAFSSSPNFAR